MKRAARGDAMHASLLFTLLLLFAGPAAASPDVVTLNWEKITFAHGYRVEIKDARGRIIVSRLVSGNSLRVKLARGVYLHRLTVLNKFRKPSGQTQWKSFSTARSSISLNEDTRAKKKTPSGKTAVKPPRENTAGPVWARWVPGASHLYAGNTNQGAPRLAALGALVGAGSFALWHAQRTRAANTNDPLQRFFREPELYLAVRDALNVQTAALLYFPAQKNLEDTRSLLRRDEKIFYASVLGLGILYYFHFRGPSFEGESSARLHPRLHAGFDFTFIPGGSAKTLLSFVWHGRF